MSNEGAPAISFEIPVGAVSIAQLQGSCPLVDGALTLLQSTNTFWCWVTNLPSGVTSSADGSSGATPANAGGFWVNTGNGPSGGGAVSQAQIRYVSVGGSDAAGTPGTFARPFRTVQAALNSITDAASTKPYMVSVGPGQTGTFAGFVLKPWVWVIGDGPQVTFLSPTAANCLGAGFAGAAAAVAGISNATIDTNLKADFNAIGSTGAGFVEFIGLELLAHSTLVGAAAGLNQALVENVYWFQALGVACTFTNMGAVQANNLQGGFNTLTTSSTDAFASFIDLFSCGGFSTLSATWTGAVTANGLFVQVGGGWPFLTNQVTVSGIGATLAGPSCQKLTVVAATPAEVQFQASFPGAAGTLIGCGGLNEIISNLGTDSAVTLHKPPNGTQLIFKNQSVHFISLTYADGVATTGCPSYIGPFDTLQGVFSSGSWILETKAQSVTAPALTAGVSAVLIPADISAQSKIVPGLNTWSGAMGVPAALAADRVNGTRAGGGGFKLTSVNQGTGAVVNTDTNVYDVVIYPGKA